MMNKNAYYFAIVGLKMNPAKAEVVSANSQSPLLYPWMAKALRNLENSSSSDPYRFGGIGSLTMNKDVFN
jgi:hypothetical protein